VTKGLMGVQLEELQSNPKLTVTH